MTFDTVRQASPEGGEITTPLPLFGGSEVKLRWECYDDEPLQALIDAVNAFFALGPADLEETKVH
ncbi:MAG: hypothetical protein ACRC6I_17280, partial [Paracoccaceae bacterium]